MNDTAKDVLLWCGLVLGLYPTACCISALLAEIASTLNEWHNRRNRS